MTSVRRARAETFGAYVDLAEPPALVAVDRALARRLGVDGGPLWETDAAAEAGATPWMPSILTAPVEVHLAVTERCPLGCATCYADATPDGSTPSLATLVARLDALAEAGVMRVALGGGEPLMRDDLAAVGRAARDRGLAVSFTTSGVGLARHDLDALRVFDQINVSHDGHGEVYARVRGVDAASHAERAIAELVERNVRVGVNVVVTRRSADHLAALAAHVATLGAKELQLLRLKPAGRATLAYLGERLSREQVAALPSTVRQIVQTGRVGVRIDCAMLPLLVHDPAVRPGDVAQFGVHGCEGGRVLAAVGVTGALAPCSFDRVSSSATPDRRPSREGATTGRSDADEHCHTPVSRDGAASSAELLRAYRDDPALATFRRHADEPPAPCATCDFASACRGGCRVVARFVAGDVHAPDPECPRVIAHAARG